MQGEGERDVEEIEGGERGAEEEVQDPPQQQPVSFGRERREA